MSIATMRRGQPYSNALWLVCLVTLTASGCGSTTATAVSSPSPVRCQMTVSAQPTSFPPDGGSAVVNVTSARECAWNAATEAGWLRLSPASGQGDGVVTATVASNDQPQPRSGQLTVNDQRITLSQEPRPCTYELSASSQRFNVQGGRGRFDVRALSGCPWTPSSSGNWLRVIAGAGPGDATVEFEVEANQGEGREASITVASRSFTVQQSGVGGTAPGCSFALRPATATVVGNGGEGRFRVDTANDCEWTASSTASWILVSRRSGTGSGDVAYSVVTNPTDRRRSGSVSVGGQAHTVTQEPGARPCSFVVSPTTNRVSAAGGWFEFQVDAEAACRWSAVAAESWITIAPGGPYGTGSAPVGYVVARNTARASRTTTINVGGKTHTVVQAAAP